MIRLITIDTISLSSYSFITPQPVLKAISVFIMNPSPTESRSNKVGVLAINGKVVNIDTLAVMLPPYRLHH